MPGDMTRRANRTEAVSQGDSHGSDLRAGRSGAEIRRGRAGTARFFADSHGVSPDPILIVGLEDTSSGDLVFRRHSVVACTDRRGAARS